MTLAVRNLGTMAKRQDLAALEAPIESQATKVARHWARLGPDIDIQTLTIGLQISQLSILNVQLFDRICAPYGITASDAAMLMVLRRAAKDTPVRPSDLGKMFNLSPGTVTWRVNRLTRVKLVERASVQGDGRSYHLELTPEGERVVDAVVIAKTHAARERLGALDSLPGGRDAFARLLERLVEAWTMAKT
jgi:DNA-binding MarR family transcriptional regulator